MTHAGILRAEALGVDCEATDPVRIGRCEYCGEDIYDTDKYIVVPCRGRFCNNECLYEYFDAEVING